MIHDRASAYNKELPLIEPLIPLVGDKKEVKIADLGSGPFSVIGRTLEGVKVEVFPSDGRAWNYKKWEIVPLFPSEVQNMEKLTYPDNSFDIVTCMNAVDHTKNALAAVKEMMRVVKPGGWVYINCFLDQRMTGYLHFWNAKEDGVFESPRGRFDLKELGFSIKYIDKQDPSLPRPLPLQLRRHNQMVATYQKK